MFVIEYLRDAIPHPPHVLQRVLAPDTTLEEAEQRAMAGFADAKAIYGAGGYRVLDPANELPLALWSEKHNS